MMHIACIVIPGYSHVQSLLWGINILVEQGHTVSIFTDRSFEDMIHAVGARCEHVELVPQHRDATTNSNILYVSHMLGHWTKAYNQLKELCTKDTYDLIIYDSATRIGKYIGYTLHIPTICWSTMVPLHIQHSLTKTSYLHLMVWDISKHLKSFFHMCLAIVHIIQHYTPESYTELRSRLYDDRDTPQFVCIPNILHTYGPTDTAHWIGSPVVYRKERPISKDLKTILKNHRIVYISFGTLLPIDQARIHYFRTLFDASWTIIISTGDATLTGNIYDNVYCFQSVPQLEVLHHATLCIAHGGINTCIEAVYASVPLLLFPVLIEQHINSDLLVQHGLARKASFHDDKKKIRADIEYLLGENNKQAYTKIHSDLPTETNMHAMILQLIGNR